jgi:hypothetical protein
MGKPLYNDEILDRIIAAATDQRRGGVKELSEEEIDIGSPIGSTSGKTFVRQTRREDLRERLEAAAKRCALSTKIKERPSQAFMADDYAAVEKHLYKALRAVLPAGRIARKRLHAALATGLIDGDVHQEIVGLHKLHRRARAARRRKQLKPKIPRSERNPGEWPLDELIADLIAIYEDIFEREPGTSVGSPNTERKGKAGGPLPRFIRAALSPILPKVPTQGAIRERVQKVLQKSASEKS